MGAGLPSWEKLLEMVAGEKRTANLAQLDSPLDQADYLRRELGDQLGRKVSEITSGATRYGIGHALLTALGCTEVVTTNYDDLYERAAADADHPTVPVLPFDDPAPSTPWVLKMHGDQRDPRAILLSRSDMVGYDARSRPMGSVVQALLLTRHLLVVGASTTDDNFLRLAHEVLAFRGSPRDDDAADAPLGTVVTLTSSHVEVWLVDTPAASANPNLDHVLREAADVVADLRAEGRTVLVHCAAAQSRTPTVGAAYAVRHLGVPPDDALEDLLDALPDARMHTTFREAVRRVLPAVSGSGVLG